MLLFKTLYIKYLFLKDNKFKRKKKLLKVGSRHEQNNKVTENVIRDKIQNWLWVQNQFSIDSVGSKSIWSKTLLKFKIDFSNSVLLQN